MTLAANRVLAGTSPQTGRIRQMYTLGSLLAEIGGPMRLAACCGFIAVTLAGAGCAKGGGADDWTADLQVDKTTLVSTGSNPFFPLRAGHQVILEKGTRKLVVTVLNETAMIDGVETRVVEERETEADKLGEISRNYFALDPATRNVYYFGEDVDEYTNGQVTGHEGGWRSGVNGARFGMAMPGVPRLGARYAQELAPGIAMDRARVIATNEEFIARDVGRYQACIRTEETTPLEPKNREYKTYCPGIGLVKDGDLELTAVTIP